MLFIQLMRSLELCLKEKERFKPEQLAICKIVNASMERGEVMFGYYMRRILKSRIFYICIAISTAILTLGCYQYLLLAKEMEISLIECIDVTMGSGGIYEVIAPALISVPFLLFYTEELGKKFIYYQMLRSDKKRYYGGQLVSALIITCLIIIISLIIFCVICFAHGIIWENVGWFTKFDPSNIKEYFYGDNTWKMTLWFLALTVMFCLPWPIVGMVVSLFTKNKYIVLAAPFIIYMAWNYLTQLIYPKWNNILWVSPGSPLLRMGLPWESYWTIELTILYPIVYHVIFIGGLSLIYLLITRRRFSREGI